jgi:SNF2 family DNA or RNA helicase
MKKSENKISVLIHHILSKAVLPRITDSLEPLDRFILTELDKRTSLMRGNRGPKRGTNGGKNGEYPRGGSDQAVRGYQWDGISWLTQLRRCGLGGILADDMGLGKSLQALVSIAIMRLELIAESNNKTNNAIRENENTIGRKSLVVCPASLTLHWKQEILKFFPCPDLSPDPAPPSGPGPHLGPDPGFQNICNPPLLTPVLYENNLKIDDKCRSDSNEVVIASYDAVRRDRNGYFTGQVRFTLIHPCNHHQGYSYDDFLFDSLQVWSAVVLDEAHAIKNPLSATSR